MTVAARIAGVYLIAGGLLAGTATAADTKTVVTTVNGQAITTGDVEFFGFSRGLSPEEQAAQRRLLVEQLIDRQLIREFLAAKKVVADEDKLKLHVEEMNQLVIRRGAKPDELFKKLGLTPERIKSELGLTLAWAAYIEKSTPPEEIRRYFSEHRPELDGTRVRVRQVFRKALDDTTRADAEALLTRVKQEVESKAMTFEGAVRSYSQSPSAKQNGDVGWISRRGQLADELTEAAWKLAPGEVAGPIKTSFGIHLIQVTDKEPGQLSVEDARPQILEQISAQRWTDVATAERMKAKIVRP